MNKKKHQGEPMAEDSSDSCDENQNSVECAHINRAVDLTRVKKAIFKTGFLTDCPECQKMPASEDSDMDGLEFDLSLWLCLKCGNQACGRARNKHALAHYNTPHSDPHDMCVNTTVWSIWCYPCDEEINITCRQKLQEAVQQLRKLAESNKIKQQPSMPQITDMAIDTQILPYPSLGATPKMSFGDKLVSNGLPRARGLSNLGNTCFFNSVMQCLGQTPYLLQLLEETAVPGQYFRLPGGKIQKDNKETIELPPLDGTLEKWRPLTQTLAETLSELQSGRSEVYIPRMLLSRLTARMPQFGGGDQHDAHELLRHLLEAVREEDLRRYKTIILEKLGLSCKTDPSSVEEEKKQIIKFYGQQASEMLLATEQVFRGVLVSILQCQVCDHTSTRDEFFLDLSLPISEKQLPPVLRRKAEEFDENKPSKHQIKKEKRAERKKNKKQKSHKNAVGNLLKMNEDDNNKSDSESDADVEDNIEDTSSIPLKSDDASSNNNSNKGAESGYNSDKAVDNNGRNGSPDSSGTKRLQGSSFGATTGDSGVPSPVIGGHEGPASPAEASDGSATSSETNVDMGSPLGGRNSPVDEEFGDFDRPESRLAFAASKKNTIDLKAGLAKLSLLNDSENGIETNNSDSAMVEEGACGPVEPDSEKMEEDVYEDDPYSWTATLAPRYQCEEGRCTVQSCLNQFTECELLAGNNKVRCDLCTKRQGGPEKKPVYTDASKQLLIYNPPAVLILHLKRFQVCRFRSAKVCKHVKFSTLLDIAPYCSKKSQELPTIAPGQNRVLYSLYGVVEHSGSIHGGHYVAYVKVRPKLQENSYRWQFLPKNQQEKIKEVPLGAQGEPEIPTGKWYYISDSHVTEVPESKVLAAEAYLLFYERLL